MTIKTFKKKERLFSKVFGYEVKESESDDLIRGGYISTTHLDQGFYDETRDMYVRDRVSKETLESWADKINAGDPRANKVSVNHEREPHVTGVGIKGTAKVDLLEDGQYGLYVDTLIDKTKDSFDNIKYRVESGLIDAYSIEFTTRNPETMEYLDGAVQEEEKGNCIYRTLLPGTELDGWTLASQPMNEHAVMIKEIKAKKNKEVSHKMETKTEEIKKEEDPKVDVKIEEKIEEKPIEMTDEEKELLALGKEAKESKEKMIKENEFKELKESLLADLKKELKEVKVETKTQLNTESKVQESKELKDFKGMVENSKELSIGSQLKVATKFGESKNLFAGELKTKDVLSRNYNFEIKQVAGKSIMESKLGITSNQNTDTDYLLAGAELDDVFQPVIFNILNQKTTTWNLLMKEDFSNKGNNQVQFRLKIAANTSAGAYLGNAVNTGDVTRIKYMTKFKKYQAGVEIDGDMIAANRGSSVGDVFSLEVRDSTDDLMSVINAALFAETGLETAAGVIGFEYITDQAGNTSLYNVQRSQANGLASTTTADNYINGSSLTISQTNLRAAKRKAVGTEGANIENCVFITSFVQGDMFRGIYDTAQRLIPTSTRVGFEGRPSFDGIPIFEDKDCNDDDWFLVDLETHKIAIWVPPTLEMLGKDSDSQKGFIKTYFATYNLAPRRMVQIYGNATS